MQLYEEILVNALQHQRITVHFPDLEHTCSEIIEQASYFTLQKIKAIIEDDSLTDADCFQKIERIITAFEELGSNGGSRHDFG